jgi:hypothetical protein
MLIAYADQKKFCKNITYVGTVAVVVMSAIAVTLTAVDLLLHAFLLLLSSWMFLL